MYRMVKVKSLSTAIQTEAALSRGLLTLGLKYIPSYNFAQNSQIRDVIVWFDSGPRGVSIKLGGPGLDHFETGCSSAVYWPVPRSTYQSYGTIT
ncbi:unnamed protein product [Meloidogyne enterolobii]|uniref:Uncharacterized protein n=1 Tax=Meloidogyne enterolobii TaxID=390850 RepID=A0ACB0ZJ47_MELEN